MYLRTLFIGLVLLLPLEALAETQFGSRCIADVVSPVRKIVTARVHELLAADPNLTNVQVFFRTQLSLPPKTNVPLSSLLDGLNVAIEKNSDGNYVARVTGEAKRAACVTKTKVFLTIFARRKDTGKRFTSKTESELSVPGILVLTSPVAN